MYTNYDQTRECLYCLNTYPIIDFYKGTRLRRKCRYCRSGLTLPTRPKSPFDPTNAFSALALGDIDVEVHPNQTSSSSA